MLSLSTLVQILSQNVPIQYDDTLLIESDMNVTELKKEAFNLISDGFKMIGKVYGVISIDLDDPNNQKYDLAGNLIINLEGAYKAYRSLIEKDEFDLTWISLNEPKERLSISYREGVDENFLGQVKSLEMKLFYNSTEEKRSETANFNLKIIDRNKKDLFQYAKLHKEPKYKNLKRSISYNHNINVYDFQHWCKYVEKIKDLANNDKNIQFIDCNDTTLKYSEKMFSHLNLQFDLDKKIKNGVKKDCGLADLYQTDIDTWTFTYDTKTIVKDSLNLALIGQDFDFNNTITEIPKNYLFTSQEHSLKGKLISFDSICRLDDNSQSLSNIIQTDNTGDVVSIIKGPVEIKNKSHYSNNEIHDNIEYMYAYEEDDDYKNATIEDFLYFPITKESKSIAFPFEIISNITLKRDFNEVMKNDQSCLNVESFLLDTNPIKNSCSIKFETQVGFYKISNWNVISSPVHTLEIFKGKVPEKLSDHTSKLYSNLSYQSREFITITYSQNLDLKYLLGLVNYDEVEVMSIVYKNPMSENGNSVILGEVADVETLKKLVLDVRSVVNYLIYQTLYHDSSTSYKKSDLKLFPRSSQCIFWLDKTFEKIIRLWLPPLKESRVDLFLILEALSIDISKMDEFWKITGSSVSDVTKSINTWNEILEQKMGLILSTIVEGRTWCKSSLIFDGMHIQSRITSQIIKFLQEGVDPSTRKYCRKDVYPWIYNPEKYNL